jgi:hypothetical protein
VPDFQKTGETYYTQDNEGMAPLPLDKLGQPGEKGVRPVPDDLLLPVDRLHETTFYLVERQDDWAACAWFYLNKPTNGLPPLAPAQERMAGIGVPAKAAK